MLPQPNLMYVKTVLSLFVARTFRNFIKSPKQQDRKKIIISSLISDKLPSKYVLYELIINKIDKFMLIGHFI